jgi:hypothetical protein
MRSSHFFKKTSVAEFHYLILLGHIHTGAEKRSSQNFGACMSSNPLMSSFNSLFDDAATRHLPAAY